MQDAAPAFELRCERMTDVRPVHILLVEDDLVDQKAFLRAMKSQRILNPVVIAEDGIEALDILRGRHGTKKISSPFIVVLDLNLPRMPGLEFLKELRSDESLTRTVVLVLTTSSARKDIHRAYDEHVAGYLLKADMGQSFADALVRLNAYWNVVVLPENPVGPGHADTLETHRD